MPVTAEQFRKVVGHFATGVTVITTENAEGIRYGLTANAFTSVSLNPLLVLVCLDNLLSGLETFKESKKFGLNILAEDQEDWSDYFSQSGTDRSQAPYVTGKTGVPLLEGVVAWLECEVTAMYPGGDHTIVVGEVKHAEIVEPEKDPLLFHNGRYRGLR